MHLYALGSNGNHQLSLGHDDDVSVPSPCILPSELSLSSDTDWRIVCGGNHTLLLVNGALYACGSNEHHQLGLDVPHLFTLTRIHTSQTWKTAACGFDFTVLVDASDELYVAGRNQKGALGLNSMTQTSSLQRINFEMGDRQVLDIKASLNHVVMMLSDGTMYGWGSTRKFALGGQHASMSLNTPTRISLWQGVEVPKHMAIGKDWTVVVTDKEVHHAGPKSRWNIIPQSTSIGSIVSVSSNWSTLHYLMRDGSVVSTGRGDRGQCPPSDLPSLKLLSSGSEHSVAIGKDDRVYVWGWNEHGNCGPGTDDVTEIRTLTVPGKVLGCAAGYGTTFIWSE